MAKILFLYSELMPYMEAVVHSLVYDYADEVGLVCWDKKKLTPHSRQLEGISFNVPRSTLSFKRLEEIVEEFRPDIIYVSGRMDKFYLRAIRKRNRTFITVGGIDTVWELSAKSLFKCLLGRFLYKRYFDYLWVPGYRQYVMAQGLGYSSKQIICNLYSADVNLFDRKAASKKRAKSVVFAGRLAEVKGVQLLIEVFDRLHKDFPDWRLIIIGNGPLDLELPSRDWIVKYNWKNQDELSLILAESTIFCLPSVWEPWGVVVHEAAAAGTVLLLSDEVGALPQLLIQGYNGYSFVSGNSASLEYHLKSLLGMDEDSLLQMGERSAELAKGISPVIAAASLRSIMFR